MTGTGLFVIESDGSVHELIFAGDAKWDEKEIGNIFTDIEPVSKQAFNNALSKGDLND